MSRRILDTNILLNHWHGFPRAGKHRTTVAQARGWARTLISYRESNLIVSPVYIETIVGCQSRHSLELAEAYLSEFEVLDNWQLKPEDMMEARRIARRIPWDRTQRDFADCLIRAIGRRFRRDIDTEDKRFPY